MGSSRSVRGGIYQNSIYLQATRTVTIMKDYDYCEECRLYGDDYGYDRNGDLVSNCYDCPMNPDSDAWMREQNEVT